MNRLISIDIDGTLLRRESGEPDPDDLAAIRAAEAQGVTVVLATGRSHFSSQPVVDLYMPGEPHITYNGAWTVGPGGAPVLRDLRVPIDISCEVLSHCREIGVAVRVFLPDAVIMSQEPAPDEAFFKYRSFERVDTSIAETLDIEPMQLVIVHRDDIPGILAQVRGHTRGERPALAAHRARP